MADTALKLYGVESAGCSYDSPNTNFGSSSTVRYGSGDKLYIKLEAFPDEYKYRAITNLTPYVYATGFDIDYSSARGKITFGAVREAFDVDTVTYATRPRDSEINDATIYHGDIPAYITVYPENDIDLIRAIFEYGLLTQEQTLCSGQHGTQKNLMSRYESAKKMYHLQSANWMQQQAQMQRQ